MTVRTGVQLGQFEVLAALGAGGMGEVYRARDTRLGREVAIKVLPAEVSADTERLRRFEKEARAASSLNHPNIVTIYEVERINSTSFIVMELVDGKTLREVLSEGALPVRKLLTNAVQIAEGLARAHSAGIVHRDLKPENVMVTKEGLVKILDFGLAKLAHPELEGGQLTQGATVSGGTSPGVVMGTVGYMSPEQASGHPVDFRSDQFSFGSLLYEMATGKGPFRRATAAQTLAAIIQDEPEPVVAVNPKVPAPLRWIVERCLAKDPEGRYASTKDLTRELATVRDHLSETLSGGIVAAAAPRRRMIIPLALAVLAAVAGALWIGRSLQTGPPSQPRYQRLTFRRGGIPSARFAPDGRTVLYSAAWEGDPLRLFSTRIEDRESSRLELPDADLASVSSTGEMAILLDGRFTSGRAVLARVPIAGGAPREVAEKIVAADWSPDGRQLAIIRRQSGRSRIEFPIGKVLYETTGALIGLRLSPKGKLIAFTEVNVDRRSIRVVDLSGRMTVVVRNERWANNRLGWSPDEREIWFTSADRLDPWVAPLRAASLSGRQRVVLRLPAWIRIQDTSRDGKVLITVMNMRARIFGATPGAEERDLSWHEGSFLRDLAADGSMVLFDEAGEGESRNVIYVRKMDGSPAKRLGEGEAMALSPDRRWAAAVGPPTGERPGLLVLLPVGVGQTRTLDLSGLGTDEWWARWFPDGKRLLVLALRKNRQLATYALDIERRTFREIAPAGADCSTISPDSNQVACLDTEGKGVIYSLAGGRPRPIPGLLIGERAIQWSAQGDSLFVGNTDEIPVKVFRLDLSTGKRELWREIRPPETAGLDTDSFNVHMSTDGRAYAYTAWYIPSDLYLVTGLR
jgi:Tol biopolymer transport system component/predicted Ser/Thr protein kinase